MQIGEREHGGGGQSKAGRLNGGGADAILTNYNFENKYKYNSARNKKKPAGLVGVLKKGTFDRT